MSNKVEATWHPNTGPQTTRFTGGTTMSEEDNLLDRMTDLTSQLSTSVDALLGIHNPSTDYDRHQRQVKTVETITAAVAEAGTAIAAVLAARRFPEPEPSVSGSDRG